eukprot:scpid56548/ scgid11318/ 
MRVCKCSKPTIDCTTTITSVGHRARDWTEALSLLLLGLYVTKGLRKGVPHTIFFTLVPNLQEAIPAASAHSKTILCHTQAADSVVMTSKNTNTFSSESVPDIAIEIVVTSE